MPSFISSAFWFCLDKITGNWKEISALIGATIMTYFGAVQSVFAGWGRFEWAAFFIAAALSIWILLSVGSAIRAWGRTKTIVAQYTEKAINTANINPLLPDFRDQRLRLSDFFHPYFRQKNNTSFRSCELFGPCNVFLEGNTNLRGANHFESCEFVVVKSPVTVSSVVRFNNTSFTDCQFFRLTFYVDANLARSLKTALGTGMNIVSDGTCGNI